MMARLFASRCGGCLKWRRVLQASCFTVAALIWLTYSRTVLTTTCLPVDLEEQPTSDARAARGSIVTAGVVVNNTHNGSRQTGPATHDHPRDQVRLNSNKTVLEGVEGAADAPVAQDEKNGFLPPPPATNAITHLKPASERISQRGFYQINDEQRYIYSSFLDVRFSTPYLRMFGIQESDLSSAVHCRLNFANGSWIEAPPEVQYPIYAKWPSPKMKYLAYYYGCAFPAALKDSLPSGMHGSAMVKDSHLQSQLPVTTLGTAHDRKPLAVCVKAAWGQIDPFRLVEWIESNRRLGVDKFVIYDSAVLGAATRVLEYYSQAGVVEVIPYTFILNMATLMMKDPMRGKLQNDDYLLEQGYLVSINDCYYRLRDRYRYILLIDIDELLVPTGDDSLISMTERLQKEIPDASAFVFPVAWHFEEFGETTKGDEAVPEFMYMQRHLRRTHVMNPANDQPKAIINTDGAVSVNWHGVVNIPVDEGYRGNYNVGWADYGYVHHFRRNCKTKYNDQECDFMQSMTEVDEVIPRLLGVRDKVREVLKQNFLL